MVLTILKLLYTKSFAVNKIISGEVKYISTVFLISHLLKKKEKKSETSVKPAHIRIR